MRRPLSALAVLVTISGSSLSAPLSPPDEASAEQSEQMCRIAAQEQGARGSALAQSIQACVSQQNPSLSYWEQCRQSARRAHLTGAALLGSVNACLSRER